MSQSFRTPAKRINPHGAAHAGTGHFIAQRVSAIALAIVLPVFVVTLALSGAPDSFAARSYFASPFGAIVSLLTLTAALYHMRLGLQVVVEDYIHTVATRTALLVLNSLLAAGLWLAAAYALLTLAL
ncbi:succinate dehydrogenase, hydrophobic membrane anchor protein [Hyphobacterium marinum]|uniref:Succinate dehydrogenase hydrophobic membrane anchor subunit n=1 Tax=Hyphobacterium marinum TaxID=3116574 RepID=A0ABU7LVL9_9PROT|nr:succinate dehydrogenase, hydrophobic membrane anchor protein [Hyphobacterium sp. Y6023]MEE2565569.1 succinate dehydrogenase, hydrophobic membrane anchor protein [Hyphobacterium sp. Y6023]